MWFENRSKKFNLCFKHPKNDRLNYSLEVQFVFMIDLKKT